MDVRYNGEVMLPWNGYFQDGGLMFDGENSKRKER